MNWVGGVDIRFGWWGMFWLEQALVHMQVIFLRTFKLPFLVYKVLFYS